MKKKIITAILYVVAAAAVLIFEHKCKQRAQAKIESTKAS